MKPGELGLALDLGTTTLGGCLVDASGEVLSEARLANPQAVLGADIIRRLEASLKGEGEKLQGLLVKGIESLVAELLRLAGRSRKEIGAAAAAGNSGITYLLRNLPVDKILYPPHRPSDCEGGYIPVEDLGLDLPVPLYLFPLVSGYVGGDMVAFLFNGEKPDSGTLFIDIGTNGEMALFTEQGWWTTSVAAGPAFEGGGISCGLSLQPGAVKGVRRRGDRLILEVEGGGSPRGLCGSGLVEAIAVGLDGGLIDHRGSLRDAADVETNLSRYLVDTPRGRAICLYRDAFTELLLTQQDIRNFQLGKGAILAGVECLLARAGLGPRKISEVVITGAFGFSLGAEVLKKVAILPPDMVNRVHFVHGGCVEGCRRFLLEPQGADRAQALSDSLKPFPLSGTPAFEKAFLKALDF